VHLVPCVTPQVVSKNFHDLDGRDRQGLAAGYPDQTAPGFPAVLTGEPLR
jgi:hypothetical protein